MTTLTSPTTADQPQERPIRRRRDLPALTGALFVLGVLGAAIAWGSTPDGDASAGTVIAHYTEHRTQGIVAALVLVLATVPALAFAARLRERARLAMSADSALPNLVFGAGVVMAVGFLVMGAIHLALSDYSRILNPSAAQALNALDGDSFVLLAPGIGTLVLAGSLIAIRSRLLPAWLGWVGIPIAIAMFTPAGFFAMIASGVWILVSSLLLYASGGQSGDGANVDRLGADRRADGGARRMRWHRPVAKES